MLRLLGSNKVLCNGLSRRDLLHLGGLGLFGLGLGDFLRLQDAKAASRKSGGHFGKAKACVLLYLYGSPSQHETFDPKPGAPAEVRGEMKAISTANPGMQICEGLPLTAKILDRVTVVRSLTHPYPLHGTVYAMSGIPTVDTAIEAKPRDPRQWPFIGSIVDYLADQRSPGVPPPVPRNVALPFLLGAHANYPPLAGPYATFLGAAYDPVWTDFTDKGTKPAPKVDPTDKGNHFDPYAGIRPSARFKLAEADGLTEKQARERFQQRRSLLTQFDAAREWLETDERVRTYDRQQGLAYTLLTSSKMRAALDVDQEPSKVRDRYGMTLFGQATLAARRLIEAGSVFVTVFWDAWDFNGAAWDTHYFHFPRMKNLLLPGFDAAYSALIADLEARGLLDQTLVLCFSEHGRTPHIQNVPGGGRNHWSRAYLAILAGGGMARGHVVGKTDAVAGDVLSTPVSPKDILATSFHLLGIDPDTRVFDRLHRPYFIAGEGEVRPEFLM